jgi:hypothetical protein
MLAGKPPFQGTSPLDSASVLKLEASELPQGIRLSFMARAGRSYSILNRDTQDDAGWQRLSDFGPEVRDHQVEFILAGADTGAARSGAPTRDRPRRAVALAAMKICSPCAI